MGIVKLGKKIYYANPGENERTSYNDEIVGLIDVLLMDHEVKIFSDNDITNVHSGEHSVKNCLDENIECDILWVFNGVDDPEMVKKIEWYQRHTGHFSVLLKTDLSLPLQGLFYDEFLDQSLSSPDYGHLEKLFLVDKQRLPETFDLYSTRKKCLVYIGNERPDRFGTLKNFLGAQQHIDFYGKYTNDFFCKAPNYKGKIQFLAGQKKLLTYRYGLYITDKIYQQCDWMTQRYWEYVLNDCVAIIDASVDRHNLYFAADDPRLVKDAGGMRKLIQKCNDNQQLYESIRDLQRRELLDEYFTGNFMRRFLWQKLKQWGFQ